jgi:arylsulfatase A-like enzyme
VRCGSRPARSRGNVSNVDFAPTITAIGGTAMPAADGVDLRGGSSGRGILLEYRGDPPDQGDNGQAGNMPHYWAIRRGNWVYVEYDSGHKELYDLAADPWQQVNVAGQRPIQASPRSWLACGRGLKPPLTCEPLERVTRIEFVDGPTRT